MGFRFRILARSGGWWVRSQQRLFHPLGRELTSDERGGLAGFYSESLLSRVRIHRLEPGTEPLWRRATSLGLMIPFDLQRMAAITLDATIVLARGAPSNGLLWSRLLFHELVHVVQYSLLGVDEFVRRYVTGWARNGFRYHRIPLERDAWELEHRFVANPVLGFPVQMEVERQLGNWKSSILAASRLAP